MEDARGAENGQEEPQGLDHVMAAHFKFEALFIAVAAAGSKRPSPSLSPSLLFSDN